MWLVGSVATPWEGTSAGDTSVMAGVTTVTSSGGCIPRSALATENPRKAEQHGARKRRARSKEDGRGITAMPMGRLCEGLRVARGWQVDHAAVIRCAYDFMNGVRTFFNIFD